MPAMAMRVAACVAAASFALIACSPFGGTATTSSPTPAATPNPSPEQLPTPSPTPTPEPTPSPVAPTPVTLYLQLLLSDYGFLSAQTVAGATCTARATLPNGSSPPGLRNPQVAGSDGMVSWSYPQPTTDAGTGVHIVSCSSGALSATQSINFQVGA